MTETSAIVFQNEGLTINKGEYDVIREMVSKQQPTDAELKVYFYECARRGVHPLDKLIHFTKRNGGMVLITSIDYMRMRAESSGAYAGSDEPAFELEGQPTKDNPGGLKLARVTVWKIVNGTRCAFTAVAFWSEYKPADMASSSAFMWRKMPHTMLAKCAETLALRKGFPGQLQGLYTPEEMAQAGGTDVIDGTSRSAETSEKHEERANQETRKLEGLPSGSVESMAINLESALTSNTVLTANEFWKFSKAVPFDDDFAKEMIAQATGPDKKTKWNQAVKLLLDQYFSINPVDTTTQAEPEKPAEAPDVPEKKPYNPKDDPDIPF